MIADHSCGVVTKSIALFPSFFFMSPAFSCFLFHSGGNTPFYSS